MSPSTTPTDPSACTEAALLEELAELDELALRILHELVSDAQHSATMSLPRLGKRLGWGASVLLRRLTAMSEASVAGLAGPGWVRVQRDDQRWLVALTEAGRNQYRHWLTLLEQAQALQERRIDADPAQSEAQP